ncbi:MAG: phosphoglucosamine mutase [Pirellulaceae bacterium]|nr:phosphoglucosamine mutase [Pirellulaceae bacterium]
MSEPIISVSGLRGVLGEQLTPAVAVRYVAALAANLPKGLVVIGRDGRHSGALLAQAVSSTLLAHGLDVADLGPAATPTVGIQVRTLGAVAGIQISASHNPKQYNGLKLFGADGRVLPKTQGESVLEGYRASLARWSNVEHLGRIVEVADAHAAHLNLVLGTIAGAAVRKRQFRVLLDSNHGAGSILGRRLLEALGCQITVLGDVPDGQFWHPPEPLAENLGQVCQRVADGHYDVGFCQDPDADRLAVIDERGRFIGEELTLGLCLLQALPQHAGSGGCVVTNCATSSVSRYVAEKFGCHVVQSAVGEANVADAMLQQHAVFGGEGNGGPIDPAVGYVRDSFVGMARILSLLASSGQTVSQHVAALPPLAMIKDKIQLSSAELPALFKKLVTAMPEAASSTLDGLKLQWPDRWLLVRGSNTEPIVRFMTEAPTTQQARQLCDQAMQIAAMK